MDQRNEFSKWISAVEEALADEGKPLAEDKPALDECGCGEWSCKTCFPDDTEEKPKATQALGAGKGVKIGNIVTKTEFEPTGGEDSPMTHAEDNLDENPLNFDDEDDFEEYDDREFQDDDDRSMFADPGGNSALRAATDDNPRIYPCPSCGAEDALTLQDKRRGYQCDRCADAAEGGYDIDEQPQNTLDVEQPLFGEEQSQLGAGSGNHNYTDQDDAMDLKKSIEYMQSMGLSNSDRAYNEDELNRMTPEQLEKHHSEVMGNTTGGASPDMDEATGPMPAPKPNKPKTDTKQEDDPFWNDMDNLFNPKPDQPLANIPDEQGNEPVGNEPTASLPVASRQSTQDRLSNMNPSDGMRRSMDLINRAAITPDTEEPVIPQNELVVRTARDVPAVVSTAMRAAGVQSPEWHHVRNLPGMSDAHIRGMGKDIFGMFTSTPVGQIQTIANVDGQGPNTDAELRAVAGWLRDNADDLGRVEVSHGIVVPGYEVDVKEYKANGIRFHVVRDDHGQYIYAYPDNTARIQGPAARDPGTRLGGGNTPRLRESNKGKDMSLSLFEELELDQAIKSALKQLIITESEEIEESTLSKEIAWKPGSPGKQEKNQGGWNLLQLLHRNHKLSNEADMEPLPFNRDVLYGYFKNHPDHFIIVKGTHGVAAIRPSEEYFAHERNKPQTKKRPNPKGFASDPNQDLNAPYLQYQVIAFQNDGKQLDSSLFKDVDAKDKEDDDEDKFTTTDPTVQRLRMGLFHGKDTQSQYNVFKLLSDEIGRLTTMYMSGFHALRKGQLGDQKGAEAEIQPHKGSVEREKIKARSDLKNPAPALSVSEAKTRIFDRIRPILQPIIAKAYSKVSLALQDAVRDDHQGDLERLTSVRKAINEIKVAVDTKGPVALSGTLNNILTKAIEKATGANSYDKNYQTAVSNLAKGPAMKLEPLIQSLRKILIGAIR